jgi:cell division protein FtsQ
VPAVIRGAASKGGRGGASRGKRPAAGAAYSPTKLKGAASVGVDPRMAVWTAAGVVGAAALLAMAVGGARSVEHGVGKIGDRIGVALGFRLNTLTIKGGDVLSAPAIAQAAGLNPGDAILGVDLDRLRERVEGVGWVKSAKVQRLLPDTIVVAIKPRALLAVWQHGEAANVVDADGAVIPEAEAGGFPQLPLIVGEGANEAAAAILPLMTARPRLMARIDAFQRIDGRRWRLSLKDGGVIDLPAKDEDGALIRFDQLDARLHCLELGFERIDLRDPASTEVRMKGASPPAANTAVVGTA